VSQEFPSGDEAPLPAKEPVLRRVGRSRLILALAGFLAALAVLVAISRPTPTEREVNRWLDDFQRVRVAGDQRIPDWPLSFDGQRELVRRLTRPESRLVRPWEDLRRRLPTSLRTWVPRLPMARDRLRVVGPALIEIPKMPALQLALLEAAIEPHRANRRFAIQFATMDWPVRSVLLPSLERLAGDEDPAVRAQVAMALRGVPGGLPSVERLIGVLQGDQVSVVREAARSPYRSDADGDRVLPQHTDAQSP
jgi:hypothetical protein